MEQAYCRKTVKRYRECPETSRPETAPEPSEGRLRCAGTPSPNRTAVAPRSAFPRTRTKEKQKTAGHENLRLKAKQRRRRRIGAPCYTWNQKSDSWANAVQKLRR